MKVVDLLPRVGVRLEEAKARIEHPEDLIFDEGLEGAIKSYQILRSTAEQPEYVSIKFDGCIHPNSVLLTESGEMTILEIIKSPNQHRVLTFNFETTTEEFCDAQYPRINENNKNWVQINLQNGSHLILTEDHEVYTLNRGWIKAKDILPDDDIKEYQR